MPIESWYNFQHNNGIFEEESDSSDIDINLNASPRRSAKITKFNDNKYSNSAKKGREEEARDDLSIRSRGSNYTKD